MNRREGIQQRRVYRSLSTSATPGEFRDFELVPSCLPEIATILRVADEIQERSPRVAFLCRAYAFERAHELDPRSKGRGVRQFKTALLQKLQKEDDETRLQRSDSGDVKELFQFYQETYEDYEAQNKDRVELAKISLTLKVIYDILKAMDSGEKLIKEIMEASKNVEEKKEVYSTYNVIPLGQYGKSTIHSEINAAIYALRNIDSLPWPQERDPSKHVNLDILDWLQDKFGFQKDNVANQREHLVLLLSNIYARVEDKPTMLDDHSVNKLMDSLFENYRNWHKFLEHGSAILRKGHSSNQSIAQENTQQRKLLFIGLYLLIWGEAANIRFMPECLCYIFHNMASEIPAMISQGVETAYGGGEGSFLRNVVTPIYNLVKKEAENNKNGTASHSLWRNYDDLNEYFWSKGCFDLNWPWDQTKEFFQTCKTSITSKDKKVSSQNARKMNFVEVRSFWHIFRSFDRMWTFYILALQVMLILAWNDFTLRAATFDLSVVEDILTIFITDAALRLLRALLDITLNFKAYRWMKLTDMRRPLLKLFVAVFWVVTLPVCYLHSSEISTRMVNVISSRLGQTGKVPYLYTAAVAVYMLPNVFGVLFFLVPFFKKQLENSSWWIFQNLITWSEPRLYVGRGMHEGTLVVFGYTVFWALLLTGKLLFSYHVQIQPLVGVTRSIMAVTDIQYEWHELFPHAKYNIGAVISIWVPVILVYFMDTQIWYAILSTLYGGLVGALLRLGEVRTSRMLRSRFIKLPQAFVENLFSAQEASSNKSDYLKFARLWNQIIHSFRLVDIISNRELELLLVPEFTYGQVLKIDSKQWPPFLLTSKLPLALNMLTKTELEGKDQAQVWKRISAADFTAVAVEECYELFKLLLDHLITGVPEKRIVMAILAGVTKSIDEGKFIEWFNIKKIESLVKKFVELLETLKTLHSDESSRDELSNNAIRLLQDMVEITTRDIMVGEHCSAIIEEIDNIQKQYFPVAEKFKLGHPHGRAESDDKPKLIFTADEAVNYSLVESEAWREQINRLLLLLKTKESAMDVPSDREAQRRMTFFTNSLFMEMPKPPPVRNMLSFSVLTPYYKGDTIYTKEQIYKDNEDGVSTLFYLRKIYPDQWENFLERLGFESLGDQLHDPEFWKGQNEVELRHWASSRGQTLFRTVKGMMYYWRALNNLLEQEELDGPNAHDSVSEHISKLEAVVSTKFTYVISCEDYGTQKRLGDQHAADILSLMVEYPSLRVAYIDERETREKGKEYFSVLVKAVNGLDEEIYRIKLPGPPILGEGKPENQNHAIIFTRGEALQAIDVNQDNYLEEALKIRNLLQEFTVKHGARCPTILGMRENIFTGSVSSLGLFMSRQENTFFTIEQRILDKLKTRFHYGHPDVFDRLFHITRGGICKASKVINLSEDIFAGFNSTLRQGNVTHHEYIQVGKGRDVGLNQISKFEAKLANGNAEQAISRDIYRLGHHFDFFRMLSCYYTTIGQYFSSMLVVLTAYSFLYGRLYLALSGVEASILEIADLKHNTPLEAALASQALVQLGILMLLPMVVEIGLESGFWKAVTDFFLMQLQLASVFFTFSLGTKTHYFGRAILHGGSKSQPAKRSFVVKHVKFAENYRLYSRSHFTKALEILILLVVYSIYGKGVKGVIPYMVAEFSMWFLVVSWLFSPFFFNPSGFEWQKMVEDWDNWNQWMKRRGGIGVPRNKSWESWWNEEQEHLRYTGVAGCLWEVLLSVRFLLYQYGLVYHLDMVKGNTEIKVYLWSWLFILIVLVLLKGESMMRHWFSADYHLLFRLIKAVLFLGCVGILVSMFAFFSFTISDLFICLMAFLPTGWAILQLSLACKPVVEYFMLWDCVKRLAQGYDYMIGLAIFTPVALVAWFPFISEFQSRLLFNQAFSRGLQISRILAGEKKGSDD